MKANTVTLPLIVAILIFSFVWAIGMLTLKSAAITTKASIEMLELHAEVVRLHDQLVTHSQRNLEGAVATPEAVEAEASEQVAAETEASGELSVSETGAAR